MFIKTVEVKKKDTSQMQENIDILVLIRY